MTISSFETTYVAQCRLTPSFIAEFLTAVCRVMWCTAQSSLPGSPCRSRLLAIPSNPANRCRYDFDPASLERLVLFAFTFSAPQRPMESVSEMARIAFQQALGEISRGHLRHLRGISLDSVEVREGSMIVDLLITLPSVISALGGAIVPLAATVPPQMLVVGGSAIGGMTTASVRWIADKAVGGAIGRLNRSADEARIVSRVGHVGSIGTSV
jgi:hypothetical protein